MLFMGLCTFMVVFAMYNLCFFFFFLIYRYYFSIFYLWLARRLQLTRRHVLFMYHGVIKGQEHCILIGCIPSIITNKYAQLPLNSWLNHNWFQGWAILRFQPKGDFHCYFLHMPNYNPTSKFMVVDWSMSALPSCSCTLASGESHSPFSWREHCCRRPSQVNICKGTVVLIGNHRPLGSLI